MVFRLSTTKVVSRPIILVEEVTPDITFIGIDTYMETSKKDEFILGDLFDYDGNKINYIWDSKKNQVASLKSKKLNTEMIISANEYLKSLYIKPDRSIDAEELSTLSTRIIDSIMKLTVPENKVIPPNIDTKVITKKSVVDEEETDQDFVFDYENDPNQPVFTSDFLEDDEEVDDFDEQLALKSQEFLKEHPELKSEMEIVRLLEGN